MLLLTCLVLGTFTKGEPISGCGGWHGETPFRQLDQLELLEVGLNLEIPWNQDSSSTLTVRPRKMTWKDRLISIFFYRGKLLNFRGVAPENRCFGKTGCCFLLIKASLQGMLDSSKSVIIKPSFLVMFTLLFRVCVGSRILIHTVYTKISWDIHTLAHIFDDQTWDNLGSVEPLQNIGILQVFPSIFPLYISTRIQFGVDVFLSWCMWLSALIVLVWSDQECTCKVNWNWNQSTYHNVIFYSIVLQLMCQIPHVYDL